MATLNDIVQITISTQTAAIKQAGFGVPLIVDAHTRFAERVRTYTSLTGMVTDGFLTTDAAYKCAAKLLSQNPQISTFMVGRRANLPTLQVRLTPTAVNSKKYVVKLNGTEVSFTSDASATVAEITAGLTSALQALAVPSVTITDNTTHVTLVGASAGVWFSVEASDLAVLKTQQIHADAGIAADLDAIQLENDDWYGLTMTTGSELELNAAAAWVETKKKIAFFTTQDSEAATVATGSATDIAKDLNVAAYYRSSLWFTPKFDDFLGAAVLGRCFPYNPGSLTFKFKTLAGVTASPLTSTHLTNLKAKNCNFFVTYGGLGMTAEGKMPSGEFIDAIRDRDWFESRLQTRIATLLANNPKVAFTDGGIASIEAEVRAQIDEGIKAGFLTSDTAPVIVVPKASAISSIDKAARTLNGIQFTAYLAGAVHIVAITGTISV